MNKNNLNMFKGLNEAFEQEVKERQSAYKELKKSKGLLKEDSSIKKIKDRVKEIQDEENEVIYDTDADREIRAYFNHEMDLEELHRRLEKIFDSKKQAVEYFANNELRVKASMSKKLDKNPNSNHRDRVIKVDRKDESNESDKVDTEKVLTEIASDTNSFYVGDPCYVLSDEVYDGVWYTKYNFRDGQIDVDDKYSFAVYGTAYGDGTYEDENGNLYPVDSGTIGIIPIGLVAKTEGLKNGAVFKGTNGSIECSDGIFRVHIDGKIVATIDTKGEEDDEDDWDYSYNESARTLRENCGKRLDEEEVVDQYNGYTLIKVGPSTSKGYSVYKIKNDETGKERTVGLEDSRAKSFFKDDTKHAWKNESDLKEDETILVNNTEVKPDYVITDVTELENVGAGDIQSPDIDAMLNMIQESIKEDYGEDSINIHIHSSNLIENGSFALVDIRTPEILKEFANARQEQRAVGKSLILENKRNGLLEFRVNNTTGTTKYIKRTREPEKAIREWLETEFLSEAKKEKEAKEIAERNSKVKDAIALHLQLNPELQLAVETIKMYIEVTGKEGKEAIKPMIEKIVAEFPASVEVDDETLKFNGAEEIITELFGKEWIPEKEEALNENDLFKMKKPVNFEIDNVRVLVEPNGNVSYTKKHGKQNTVKTTYSSLPSASFPSTLEEKIKYYIDTNIIKNDSRKINEAYQNFNIGNIEVIYNPQTHECLYSIESADVHDKKINLTKIPDVDTPYDTETIIKDYITKQYGPVPQEVESKEEEIPTEEVPAETENLPLDTEVVEEADEEVNPIESDMKPSNEEVPQEDKQAIEDSTSETGSAKFQKIKPNSGVSIENIRENTRQGVVQADSSYIVVETKNMTDEEFKSYTEDLSVAQDFLTGVTPIDRANYAFNVVKVTNSSARYDILVDPVGYNYSRYIAIVDKSGM